MPGHPVGVAPRAKERPLTPAKAEGLGERHATAARSQPTRSLRRAARRRRPRACAGPPRPSCRHGGPRCGRPPIPRKRPRSPELGLECRPRYRNAGCAISLPVSLSSAATFVGGGRTTENRSPAGGRGPLAGARRAPGVGAGGGREGQVRVESGSSARPAATAEAGPVRAPRVDREVRVPGQARAGPLRVQELVVLRRLSSEARPADVAPTRRLARRSPR